MKMWMLEALDELDGTNGPDDLVDGSAPAVDVRPPSFRPFDEVRALIAIACADGPPCEAEEKAVRRLLPVNDELPWRVFRPSEVGAPASALDARRILERMVGIALVDRADGVLDESERAVLLGFERAFFVEAGCVDAFVDAFVHAAPRPWWRRLLRRFDRPAVSLILREAP
jgi:uncharacterized membrane protein YebE (DUF533 family)